MSEALKLPSLSIIFSFRNEEDVLPLLVQRTREVCAGQRHARQIGSWELIFINDASSDNSLSILLDLAKNNNDIRIINMSRAFGVSPCVMAGLAHATGDVIVYMDADLQDPPELIPQMIRLWKDNPGTEVVHTVRKTRIGENQFKLFITRLGYLILNRYSNVPITPEAGDFKLLSRRAVNHLLQFREHKPFMRGLVSWIGFKQQFLPYDRQPRHAGKTKFFVLSKKVISNFLNSALINFSSVPLQIAAYCGLCAILIDGLLIVHALWQKISGHALPGWTALMIVILFIGGVQLFCIGMIGLYINSIHEQSKMRPLYIIESTFGFNHEA